MKKTVLILGCALLSAGFLNGCVAAIGNRDAQHATGGTLGQQLIDLKRAKEAGALTESEYETQKARLLAHK
jgi:hypothetical protein